MMPDSEGGHGDDSKDGKDKDICRDFLNNICNRGNRCKFYHPSDNHEKAKSAADEPYNFCLDFQNQGCFRDNCRYVHANREDVDRHKRTGEVTLGLARALAALVRGDTINGIPVCKQFQTGQCARVSQCRYWHINVEEERRKRFAGRSCGYGLAPPAQEDFYFGNYSGDGWRKSAPSAYDDDYVPFPKRAAYSSMRAPIPPPPPIAGSQNYYDLERRNAELLAEVDGLKRELQRERERYDELMHLFRSTCHQNKSDMPSNAPSHLQQHSSAVPTSNSNNGASSSSGGSLPPAASAYHQAYSWAGTESGAAPKYNWNMT